MLLVASIGAEQGLLIKFHVPGPPPHVEVIYKKLEAIVCTSFVPICYSEQRIRLPSHKRVFNNLMNLLKKFLPNTKINYSKTVSLIIYLQ